MEHLFLTAPIAQKLWRHFAIYAGTAMENMRLPHVIMSWWYSEGPSKLRMVYITDCDYLGFMEENE